MKLNLDKDLIFFDLETTGGDIVKDRIIQIGLVKYKVDGTTEEREYNINPNMPIKPDATQVHGITDEDVKDLFSFKQYAVELFDFIGDADLGGYNSNRFDVPILVEEFARVGLELDISKRRLIDALQIFYKMEPRTLKAALRFYCNQELIEAHDALADTKATAAVFMGQLERYKGKDYIDNDNNKVEEPIRNDMQAIHNFLNDPKRVDFTNRFSRNVNNEIIFNFGKHKGEVAHKHPNFLNWIINRDFPLQVKNIAKAILKGKLR
ncbi:MAG: 3'-5' exonuclease [Saprospiraceae bacterium]|nr:3'-5' exonuclease [Saprospiraceae bacterium]